MCANASRIKAVYVNKLVGLRFSRNSMRICPFSYSGVGCVIMRSVFPYTGRIVSKCLCSVSLTVNLIASIVPFSCAYIITSSANRFRSSTLYKFQRVHPAVGKRCGVFAAGVCLLRRNLGQGGVACTLRRLCARRKGLGANLRS